MDDPINRSLDQLRQEIRAAGAVDADAVKRLKELLGSQRPIGRDEAELLFDINAEVSGSRNDPSWQAFFVEAISDHVLEDEQSPGEVDASEAEWLVNRIEADQQYDDTEKALLANIKHFIRHDEVWGGIRSDDLQAATSGIIASLYSRACDGGKGGDVYYFSVSASDMLTRIAVADVLGHGRAVSDVGEWIYGSLAERMNSAEGNQVLSDLNRMAADRGYRALTTAAVVTFYRADSNLYFTNAGHPPIFLRRASDDRWRPVTLDDRSEVANMPLGVDPHMRYDQQQIPLAKGDQLILYTDGLIDAPNADRQIFGADRLAAALEAATGKTPKDVKDAVLGALREYTGGCLTHDDVTFMVVEVR